MSQVTPNPLTEIPDPKAEIDLRHHAPMLKALPQEATDYLWKRETADIRGCLHNQTSGWLYIHPQGQFYNRHAQPLTREWALEIAGHARARFLRLTIRKSISNQDQ
jgi:hypothetical protein